MFEAGRVPPATPSEAPRAFPPQEPVPVPSGPPIFGPPPFHVPPTLPPPPEEPPVDVPEPGMLFILLTGALVYWRFMR